MRLVNKIQLAALGLVIVAIIWLLFSPIGEVSYGPTCPEGVDSCVVNPVLITGRCSFPIRALSSSVRVCQEEAQQRATIAGVLGLSAVGTLLSLVFRRGARPNRGLVFRYETGSELQHAGLTEGLAWEFRHPQTLTGQLLPHHEGITSDAALAR